MLLQTLSSSEDMLMAPESARLASASVSCSTVSRPLYRTSSCVSTVFMLCK